ncbi:MAG: SdrD B-like domain-containing protein, partial [Candidatus Thorarchaeota archaeon]
MAFVDEDGDGVRDAGELGIPDVTITRDGVANETTDSDGKYSFAVLQGVPGIHNVSAAAIQGMFRTTPGTVFWNLEPGWINTTDFGYAPDEGLFGVAYGTVFNDTDHNGVQEIGEKGIAGVNVSLYNSTGHLINYNFTDSLGWYTLRVNENGNYTIIETDPDKHVSTTPNIINATLVTGSDNDSPYDFGDFKGAVIMGTVFNDLDVDGTKDVGEPLVADATVTANGESFNTGGLLDYWGGNYRLYVNDGERIYDVIETDPLGYVSTNAIPRDPNVTRVDASKVKVNVTYGNYYKADFGDVQASNVGQIWGVVYDDNGTGSLLANGQRDSGEPGIPDVNVTLCLGGELVDWVLTNASGNFYMLVTQPGVYTVSEINPPGYVSTNAMPDGGVKIDNDSCNFTVELGHSYEVIFGDVQSSSVAVILGYVFDDENEDGFFNSTSEHGIPNVNVSLGIADPIDLTVVNVIRVATSFDGSYQFAVSPGTLCRVTSAGPSDAAWYPTTPESIFARVPTAGTYPHRNFGYTNDPDVAAIYGIVFHDLNGNGKQDFGEVGLGSANVSLYEDGELLATTMTSDLGLVDGTFTFAVNETGVYNVIEVNPLGWRSTTPDNVIVHVELGQGYAVNFGDSNRTDMSSFYGTVFEDSNASGARDLAEPGIQNVTLDLYNSTGPIANYTTNRWGQYTFLIRQPEVYHVIETDLPAYVSTNAIPGDPNVTKISSNELKINITADMLG